MKSSTLETTPTPQIEDEKVENLPSIDTIATTSEDDEESLFHSLLPPTPKYNKNTIDEDLDELLGIELSTIHNGTTPKRRHLSSKASIKQHATNQRKCCVKKYGNTFILHTACEGRTRYGLMGPHYLGVIFTVSLLFGASYYFTLKAFHDIGMKSGLICVIFTILAFHNLLQVVCVDPGIVKLQDQLQRERKKRIIPNVDEDGDKVDHNDNGDEDEYEMVNIGEQQGWRYCGSCSLFQPPKAAHCPDCNVCVYEYDHHCPWMGKCIGKKNMPAFMRFNFTWLFYLLYCCLWVVAFGPLSVKKDLH